MGNKVAWFEVVGNDAGKLQQFYSKAFGWNMNVAPELNYGLVDASESGIGGGVGQAQGGTGHLTFYVEVDDLQASLDQIQGLGGSTVLPPTAVPNGPEIAMFNDPDGNLVGLLKAQSA